ncbi:DNA (cytosine-5-)-methyltransferase [Streptomyces sp. 35G-GA-8]|uniref:DNA (cytosine-5-)-methyltransferase n=1 Tax=Streptomyces sp. 35G-GA-8 TaxID=2939434 RepID=UPI00201F98FD|nr:DNA (cytosine-5-)-methyltransferase [Streptomyces sp. 35G-GA-8]MCL7377047.1 DNA (cytosine-5-)-methyltransferase [Streptomyces sp. 35G-GA-8]
MTATEPAIGSLFSGVGGLDLGVTAALGGHATWHAETDPHATQVLARHWPQTPNLGDVQAIDWHRVEPVCVLTAGFPCQDLSVAGPRIGLGSGTRSGLWRHVVTAIDALNPCLVVIENVRGLLSTRAGTHALRHLEPCTRCVGDTPAQPRMRSLGVLLADLAALGYDANWTCVRASDVGAPHQRARVFLTAWPAAPGQRTVVEDPDIEPGQQRRLPAPCQTEGRRPRTHLGRRDRTPPAHTEGQRRHEGLTETEARRRQPHPGLHRGHACCSLHTDRGIHRAATRPTAALRYTQDSRPQSHTGGPNQAPTAHPDLGGRERRSRHEPETPRRHEPANSRNSPAHWWGHYLPAIRRWEHVTQRPAPMPTQPGTRRLSAAFVEWMMSLPKGWVTATEGLSRATQLRLLGNSVVPQQAAHALGVLLPDGIPSHAPPVLRHRGCSG